MKKDVIVCGSIITDMSVKVKKHPKVGETVIGENLTYSPGGKGANQAVSASRLGAFTTMIGAIGNDAFGKMSQDFLDKEDIVTIFKKDTEFSTGAAMIVVNENGDNNIVVNLGANENLDEYFVLSYEFNNSILVSQFEIPIELIIAFFERSKSNNNINIFNPAPYNDYFPDELMKLIDVLILNESEFKSMFGFGFTENSDLKFETQLNIIETHIKKYNQIMILTLGEKGCVGFINDVIVKISGYKVNAIDTTGAGDCFVGAIAAYLSEHEINNNIDLRNAMEFANKAASLSVQKCGSGISMPYFKDIQNEILQND